jgi:hypothetical protein
MLGARRHGRGGMVREQRAAGAERACAAQASTLAGSVEEAEGRARRARTWAYLTFGIIGSARDQRRSEAQRSQPAHGAVVETWAVRMRMACTFTTATRR